MVEVLQPEFDWSVNNHVAQVAQAPPVQSVHILTREHPGDWHWHPYLMARIKHFCDEHEQQADAITLIHQVQQAFVMEDPGLMVIGVFVDGHLVGHVLCERVLLYFRPIVTVHQYMIDKPITNETRRDIIRLIREYAADTGPNDDREPAEFIQWLVRDKALVRVYQRYFKAEPHLLLMRMNVEE